MQLAGWLAGISKKETQCGLVYTVMNDTENTLLHLIDQQERCGEERGK